MSIEDPLTNVEEWIGRLKLNRRKLPALVLRLGNPTSCWSILDELVNKGGETLRVLVWTLKAPPSRVKEGELTIWDGDLAHRVAVEGLARLRHRDAVPLLLRMLNGLSEDSEPILHAKVIWALGEIGDPVAVTSLIPLLGVTRIVKEISFPHSSDVWHQSAIEMTLKEVDGKSIGEIAGTSLRKMGKADLVDAFFRTLRGNRSAVSVLQKEYRSEIISAFVNALQSMATETAANAAWTLGELGALEALQAVRARTGPFRIIGQRVRVECERVLARLESHATLPRHSEDGIPRDRLPSASKSSAAQNEHLPRTTKS